MADLFADIGARGATLLAARYPRAYLDLNRAPDELEQALFDERLPEAGAPRARAGLGIVPRLVAENAPIYDGKLSIADAQARIRDIHQPFHARLAELLETMRARHGHAVLLDAHSMPAQAVRHFVARAPDGAARPVDVVLGDRHGRACHRAVREAAQDFLTMRGYGVALNQPYAGGYITEHYGRPAAQTHALQIEISRALYMDEESYSPTGGYERVKADMAALAERLISLAPTLKHTGSLPSAAE